MKKILSKLSELVVDAFTHASDAVYMFRWGILVAFTVVLMFFGISSISEMHTYDVTVLNNSGAVVGSYKGVSAVRFRFVGDDVILDAAKGGVALYIEHTDNTQIIVERID